MVQKLSKTIVVLICLFSSIGAFAKEKKSTLIHHEFIIDAGIEKAWTILGPGFTEAYLWAAAVNHSKSLDNTNFHGSTCTERGCNVSGIGNIKEKLLQYSQSDHLLSYQIYEGMPSMVKYASNTWRLTDLGNGKTKLVMDIEMKIEGVMGNMMKGMMKKKMTKLMKQTAEEFKYYVETGKAHDRKIAAANKYNKKHKN